MNSLDMDHIIGPEPVNLSKQEFLNSFEVAGRAAVVLLVQSNEGGLAVQVRRDFPNKGQVEFPGGFVKHPESLAARTVRIAAREMGINMIDLLDLPKDMFSSPEGLEEFYRRFSLSVIEDLKGDLRGTVYQHIMNFKDWGDRRLELAIGEANKEYGLAISFAREKPESLIPSHEHILNILKKRKLANIWG